jgi:coenzyme F420-reducing hydrogenase beta subunit
MRGSKYVQSRIGDSYQQTKRFLVQDRLVLFSGTQCQIAGLNRFLRKHYPKLLTLEVICHGAPSPKVWQNYLKAHKGISEINFRSKKNGWKTFSFEIYSSTENITEFFGKNTYMQAFLSNLSLRPSCYACPAKSGKSGADITLGDFWGIDHWHPEFDDDKGCSAVMLNTGKGEKWFNTIYKQLHVLESTYNNVLYGNASLEQSVKEPIYRRYFFHLLRKGAPLETIINKITSKNLYLRICRVIYRKFGI